MRQPPRAPPAGVPRRHRPARRAARRRALRDAARGSGTRRRSTRRATGSSMRLQERTADEWMAIFRANGNVAAEEYLTTAEALDHPDLVGNGDIVTLDDPVHGPVRTIGPIAELTADAGGRSAAPRRSPAQHTAEVLGERAAPTTDRRPAAVPTTAAAARSPARRRHGRRVRHDHRRAAGDVDARRPRRPRRQGRADRRRPVPPPRRRAARRSPRRRPASRRSASTSSRTTGRRIAQELAATADVVVHNARPGVPERLGLGERAAARRPARADLGLADRLRPRTARAPTGRRRIRAPARRPVAPGTSPAPR